MKYNRRLIEDFFPVKEVGVESSKEKSIRHGHPSTLHVWWARRPLASSRTTAYAALVEPPINDKQKVKEREFIINLSKWTNSTNHRLINEARRKILETYKEPPKILDPFAGGGSIPFEALRLGCEVHSSDLNPISVLIQKCLLEYPQRYGNLESSLNIESFAETSRKKLLDDVLYWGKWVEGEARKELQEYYVKKNDDFPVGFLWARTITCQNPSCSIEIPLLKQYWLARKKEKEIALYPTVDNNEIVFEIVGTNLKKIPADFDPYEGTISRATVSCPKCGSTIDSDNTRRLFQEKKTGSRLLVIINSKKGQGKSYRIAGKSDLIPFNKTKDELIKKSKLLEKKWGITPLPNEETPKGGGPGAERAFSNRNYGLEKWHDMFNDRQLLTLITFVDKIRDAYSKISLEEESEYAKAIVTYLALNLDRLAAYCSTLGYWHVTGEKISPAMQRQAIAMVFDYVESVPFATSFSWRTNLNWILRVIEKSYDIPKNPIDVEIRQASATALEYPSGYFDAVFTDPPYYDNVPYSYLSDYYYVWAKRTVGHLYPELFSTPLSPKKNEIVAYSHGAGGFNEGKQFFEENLSKAFKEIHRVLKSGGVTIIVFAHKSTKGWETLINSLLDSGLIITGAWPIHTEMTGRLRARESAALASSIYIVARKIERNTTAIYKDVKKELESYLTEKLERLWSEDIGGADFFIAAIGSAIEVFGKYEKVIDYEGTTIRADRLLDDVRQMATDFAIRQILQNGFSTQISPLTRFYLLYRWNYNVTKIQFDEARKLAQSCGIDLTDQWGERTFIRKQKEFIKVVGPKERKIEDVKDSTLLIDILHYILLLWEKGSKEQISKILTEKKLENSEMFWRVAQAISETLPTQNKEKKLLDGFLAGRTGYQSEDRYEQETLE